MCLGSVQHRSLCHLAQAFWEAGRQGEFIEESLGGKGAKGAKGARATVSNKPWYNRLTQLS